MIHHTVSVSIASASFLVYFLLTFPDGANAGFFGSSSSSSFGFSSGVSSSSSSGLSSFSSSQSGGARPHDITSKQGLTNLYNSGVASVERVSRPMGGVIGAVGVPHSGVVVTTNSGDRWLVHKGKGYGDSSQTVVTNAKHMSGAWTSGGAQLAQPGTKVADYVKAGGGSYNGIFDNCHDASRRMMNVGKGKR